MHRTRAERRHFMKRAKRRARRIIKYIWNIGNPANARLDKETGILYECVGRDEHGHYKPIPVEETVDGRMVGHNASTHCHPSCAFCWAWDVETKKQDMIADLDYNEQLDETIYEGEDWLEDEDESSPML